MRVMLDSNILIDYLAKRQPFYKSAEMIMVLGYVGELELWFSYGQANDVFYVLTQGAKVPLDEVKASLKRICSFVHICHAGEGEFDAAIDSAWSDLEDACVYQCALSVKADAVVTRDAKGFNRSSLRVFDCDGLLKHLLEVNQVEYELVELLED